MLCKGPKIRGKLKKKLLKKDPYCFWCRRRLKKKTATIEHMRPLSLGGLDIESNVEIACNLCNSNRGVLTSDEFRKTTFLESKKEKAIVENRVEEFKTQKKTILKLLKQDLENKDILDLFYESGLSKSRSAARRLIEEGNAYIDGVKIKSMRKITTYPSNFKLSSGKKRHIIIKVKENE